MPVQNMTPLSLRAIDTHLGANTAEAYKQAVQQAPHLGGLAIILDKRVNASHFVPSELGLAGSYISVNPDPAHYANAIRDGIVGARMGHFSRFFRSKGIQPSINELVTSVFLHELGHADDFNSYITRASGDPAKALRLANKVRESQIATLPLKTATSRARAAFVDNTGGYRDAMLDYLKSSGANWEYLLEQNTKAYTNLTCEQVADRFALGVLATIYV